LIAKPEKTYEERLQEAMKEYGIPEKLDKLQQQSLKVAELKSKIDKLDIEMTAEIDRQYQRRVSMPEIETAIDEIKRDYTIRKAYLAAQLSTEAAVMQAYQGNLAEAKSLVTAAVNAYAADLEMERRKYEAVFNYYSDFVSDLTNEQRRILEQGYQEALRKEKEAKEEKEKVYWMKIQYPEAGITIDDSYEEAVEKAAEWKASQPEEPDLMTQIIGSAETGYQVVTIDKKTGQIVKKESIEAPVTVTEERQLTDEQIRANIRQFMRTIKTQQPSLSDDELYQLVMDDITLSDLSQADKERARLIANEMFGKKTATTEEKPITIAPKEKEEQKKTKKKREEFDMTIPSELIEQSPVSFFERLFK